MSRADASEALGRFTGTGRRFEVSLLGDVTLVDDYAHHPAEIKATIAAAREAFPGQRLRVLFQPHLVSRTRHLARELAAALAAADDIVVTDVYLAREEADAAVTGKLVVRCSLRSRPVGRVDSGRRGCGCVSLAAGRAGRRAARSRRGQRRCCARADPRAARRRAASLIRIEEAVALSRFTTIGTGGPARWLGTARDDRGAGRGARAGRPTGTRRSRPSGSARTCSSRTRVSTGSSSSSPVSSRPWRSTASCSWRAEAPPTPYASIAHGRRGSAGSSSPRRSRVWPVAVCG